MAPGGIPREGVGTNQLRRFFFFAFPYDSINCIRFKGYYLSPVRTPLKPFVSQKYMLLFNKRLGYLIYLKSFIHYFSEVFNAVKG